MTFLFHLFSDKAGKEFLFDARTYSIIEVESHLAKTLKLLRRNTLSASKREFVHKFSESAWNRVFTKVENLIKQGHISTEDDEYLSAPSLKRLILLLTDGCNLACKYCFETEKPKNCSTYRYMTRGVADACLSYLFNYSPYNEVFVNLYGGEPLLNFRVVQYLVEKGNNLSQKYQKKISWHLVTNGTLLNKTIANFIKINKIETQISIDGSNEVQNTFRVYANGRESFKTTIGNIKLLESLGVCCNLLVVLNNNNTHDISWLEQLKSLVTGRVAFCVAGTTDIKIVPNEDEWQNFLKRYALYLRKEINEKNGNVDNCYFTIGKIVNQITKGSKTYFGCGGGLEEFTVGPAGEMYICERISGKLDYNISDEPPPTALWQKYINDATNIECRKCWAKYLCGGGCAHTFYAHNGMKKPYKWHCKIKKIEIETAILALRDKFYYKKESNPLL